jgi:hypothetical protein
VATSLSWLDNVPIRVTQFHYWCVGNVDFSPSRCSFCFQSAYAIGSEVALLWVLNGSSTKLTLYTCNLISLRKLENTICIFVPQSNFYNARHAFGGREENFLQQFWNVFRFCVMVHTNLRHVHVYLFVFIERC